MTDTIIVKEEEKKPEETIEEPVVVPEDKSTEIAEAASDQAQDMLSMAASIATLLEQARNSAGNVEGFFNTIIDRLNEFDRKLDELIKLEIEEQEEEEEDNPAEVIVTEVKKPETEEVITTTEEIEEKPEPRSKTKRRFI